MNIENILQDIAQQDPEVYEKLSSRRNALKSFGSKVAIAALPLALGSMFKKAYGKTTDSVVTALNFALELEYFAFNFYHTAMATGNNTTTYLIPSADRPGFQMIEDQERAHVQLLRTTIDTMGGVPFTPKHYTADPVTGNPYSPASYDFTAGNTYTLFENYDVFLDLAQAFEDTGVRAYLGQMPNVNGNITLLKQFLQINAVEARHASYVRLLRRTLGAVDYPKPWITNNIPPVVSLQKNYLGEDNLVQDGVQIDALTGATGGTISTTAASEAFDEPLSSTTVATLIAPFLMS